MGAKKDVNSDDNLLTSGSAAAPKFDEQITTTIKLENNMAVLDYTTNF